MNFLRSDQRRVVEVILDKLDLSFKLGRSIIFLLKARTGFGKTLVALTLGDILHSEHNMNVVAFVRTRSQLSRYVEDCLKFFNTLPRVKLNKELVCPARTVMSCKSCNYQKKVSVEELIEIMQSTSLDPYDRRLLQKLADLGICPYQAFSNIESFITVCTYPYMTSPALRDEVVSYDTPNFIIVDEAHNLDNIINVEVPVTHFTKMLVLLDNLIPKLVKKFNLPPREVYKISDLTRKIRNFITRLINACSDGSFITLDERHLCEISTTFNMLYTRMKDMLLSVKPDLLEMMIETKMIIDHVITYGLNVVQVQKDRAPEVICFKSFNLSLIGKLLSQFRQVMLMSGTLPSKWYVVYVWKVKHDRIVTIEVPEKLSNVRLILVRGVTSQYRYRSINEEKYALALNEIYSLARKSVLAFFPSYEFMSRVLSHINDSIILKSDRSIGEVIQLLKRGKYIVVDVFGGRFSEGVEFLDKESDSNLISDIVIVGIPYPRYDDYLKALLNKLEREGISAKMYMVEKAWISVRQAIGRGTRGRDTVNVWLMDERYITDSMWREKLNELQVQSREEVDINQLIPQSMLKKIEKSG